MQFTDFTAFNPTLTQLPKTIICQFTMCLPHVSPLSMVFSKEVSNKEYSNGRFCYRYAYMKLEYNSHCVLTVIQHGVSTNCQHRDNSPE